MWLIVTPPDFVRSTMRSAVGVSLGEHVQRQRMWPGVDERDSRVDVVDRQHRQDRPEDLLLHHRRVRGDAGEHRRGEVAGTTVAAAAGDDGFVAAGVEQPDQPVEVTVVDDASEVRRHLRVLAVEVVHRAQHGAEELILDGPGDEDVVGGDARLAGVGEPPPRDPSGGDVDVGVGRDDRRALATELERHRGEVLRRRPHDDLRHRRAARVEDVVEALGEHRRRLLDPAGHDLNGALVEVARNQLGDEFGRRRCQLGRLEHRRVAGGERSRPTAPASGGSGSSTRR